MKLKIQAHLPFCLNEEEFRQHNNYYMEFPQIPRPGELINTYDPNCEALFKEIDDYLKSADNVFIRGFQPQVIENIFYSGGEAIVIVGSDPSKFVIEGMTPEKHPKEFILITSALPRIGDLLCDSDDWYVTSVNHLYLNHFWVGTSDEPIE